MRLTLPALAALLWAGGAQAAIIADFAADFSAASNPSGAWTYGYVGTLGAAPAVSTFLTSYGPGNEVKAWSPGVGADTYWPTIGLNTSGALVGFGNLNAVQLGAGQGILHPWPTGDYADVRLTVGLSFTGVLEVQFAGIDTVGTTTDVHVLRNGVSLFSGLIAGYGQTQSYSASIALQAGDVLDFAVGVGGNGNYVDDSTGFRATLSTVPEPGAVGLLAVGMAGLLGLRRRSARM